MHYISVLSLLFVTASQLAQAAPTRELKEWTVMVFENGKNDLDEYITMDVNEMESVGSSNAVNVVAEWGSYSRERVVRMRIERDNDLTQVTSPVLQDRGRADMGDYREVVDFVRWSVQNFPAKHYFLIISDHGAGWRETEGQVVSQDAMSGNGIHLPQLAVMGHQIQKIVGKKLDLMGFDACLMSMAEVAAEFFGLADYLIASQEVEPGYGWDYRATLGYFNRNPQATASAFGQAIIKSFVASYQGGSQGRSEVTLSLIDLSQLEAVARDARDFARIVASGASSDQKLVVAKALATAQHYYNTDYIDLANFYDLVRKTRSLDSVLNQQWFTDALTHLRRAILFNGVTPQYSRSHGLSIWGPGREDYARYIKEYRLTRFDKGTKWADLLRSLYENLQMRSIRFITQN